MVLNYDDRHRAFLQAVMQKGAINDYDTCALGFKIFKDKVNISRLAELINMKLNPISMAMKSGICELTGEKFWMIVGTTHEEAVMMPSEFSKAERAFLRAIYSEIMNSDNGCISSTDCLNLTTTLDMKLSMGDADSFIRKLKNGRWLVAMNGYIHIGVRSIVELMPYFRATYLDNFNNCSLCHEVIFSGTTCEQCKTLYHNYCLAKYINIQNENKCPSCKSPVDDSDLPVIAISQTTNQEEEELEKEDNETMDVDEAEISQVISASRRSNRKRKNH